MLDFLAMLLRNVIAVLALSAVCLAGDSIADLPKKAVERSQLTLPGSTPFHLKATVFESTDRHNESHNATIEEYWAAPDKWTRTVTAKDFSQTLTVNGDKTSDSITGDYYPAWLRNLADAIFDPGTPLQGVDMTGSSDNPILKNPRVPADLPTCRRFALRAGVPPANNVFSTYCFQDGLLESIGVPGYNASYREYKKFGEKKVARRINEYLQPGEELEAKIDLLEEFVPKDDSQFSIETSSPVLQTVDVNEAMLRSMIAESSAIQWPPIKDGKPVGVLSICVFLDRNGRVREISDLNSDNPFMTDAAKKAVMDWKFKPAVMKGNPVQIKSILTFAYQTRIGK